MARGEGEDSRVRQHREGLGRKPWRAGVALGPQFGSKDYQNLYYGVDQEFATDTRAAYSSDSGYAGSRLLMTLRSQNRIVDEHTLTKDKYIQYYMLAQ